MSTPTKPERVEAGQLWKLDGLDKRPHAVESVKDETAYFEGGGCNPVGSMITCDDWEFHGPAPATPGTATVTPHTCKHGKVGYCTDCTPPASKPPAAPAYSRMVGELRAPDGTPRTALEAIQAKRESEPWRPAVDEWDLLPDAWPR